MKSLLLEGQHSCEPSQSTATLWGAGWATDLVTLKSGWRTRTAILLAAVGGGQVGQRQGRKTHQR